MKKQTAVEWLIKKLYEYEQSGNSLTFAQMKPLLEQAKEMEKQQIIDAYNQEICLHLDKEFVPGVFGGYWCPKCNRNVDSELEQD
jgi:hypothetical protein